MNEIANMLKITASTVRRHLCHLVNNGLLKDYQHQYLPTSHLNFNCNQVPELVKQGRTTTEIAGTLKTPMPFICVWWFARKLWMVVVTCFWIREPGRNNYSVTSSQFECIQEVVVHLYERWLCRPKYTSWVNLLTAIQIVNLMFYRQKL